jgi:beta-phosphoglucomutase-like phosphatase (HAD superfamily)
MELSLSPTTCLAVEDSPAGASAAIAAGSAVLGIGTTHTRAELPPTAAFVPDLSDVEVVPAGLRIRAAQ